MSQAAAIVPVSSARGRTLIILLRQLFLVLKRPFHRVERRLDVHQSFERRRFLLGARNRCDNLAALFAYSLAKLFQVLDVIHVPTPMVACSTTHARLMLLCRFARSPP